MLYKVYTYLKYFILLSSNQIKSQSKSTFEQLNILLRLHLIIYPKFLKIHTFLQKILKFFNFFIKIKKARPKSSPYLLLFNTFHTQRLHEYKTYPLLFSLSPNT